MGHSLKFNFKIMNKSTLFTLFLALLFSSCDITDTSIPEDGMNTITPNDLLESSIAQMAFNQSALGSRTCATLVQYYGEFNSKVNSFDGYLFNSSFFSALWSDGYYAGSLVNIKELRDWAIANNDTALESIAMVLQANEFHNITLMFGDVPYSESLLGSQNIAPAYDTQEQIISALIILLDSAISKMQNADSLDPEIAASDLIFNGDIGRWIKFAYGLKARILVNKLNRGDVDFNEILFSLNNSFQNREEEAQFQFSGEIPNPHYLFATQRPYSFYISDVFYSLLTDIGGPRLPYYTVTNGSEWVHFVLNEFEPRHCRESASIPLLSYTEILFMKTEILHHMDSDVIEMGQLLKSAVISSMQDHEVEINNDAEVFADSFSDLSFLSVTQRHQRIIEQAYIAYYGFNHLQSWSNFRRTNYPALESTASGPNPLNPTNRIPVRFIYPETEYLYNSMNVNEAVNRQNGALLDADMWIFN